MTSHHLRTPAPDLLAQHAELRVNRHWPHLGRDELDQGHSVFVISEQLRRLGLADWTSRVLQWLARYDGLERHSDDGHNPTVAVRDRLIFLAGTHELLVQQQAELSCWQEMPLAQRKAFVTDHLLQLDFVSYRAFWGNDLVPNKQTRHWHPLKQIWLSFLEEGQPGEMLSVWHSPRGPLPSLHAVEEYLLT